MEITFIMLGSLNHKSSWRSFVKTPMMMLSAYLLFDCKNILMLDATRSPLSDLVPPGSEEDIYSVSYRLKKIRRETLLRMFVTDAWREKGEWLASSPAWAALRDNKPGILCWLIITNKTHNNSFPSLARHHSRSPRVWPPQPRASNKETNSSSTKKGRNNYNQTEGATILGSAAKCICIPPSLAWEPSYNGQ